MTLLILPVTTNGNPMVHVLPNYSDDFATPFLEAGYKIIDRTAAQSEAQKLGLDLEKGIEDKNVPALAAALKVDAIFLSSIAYAFVPAESGTTPATFNTVTDKKGKVTEVNVQGSSKYSHAEEYVMTSMSSRLVDAKTMTTLLTAYVEPCGGKGVNTRLVDMLRDKQIGRASCRERV